MTNRVSHELGEWMVSCIENGKVAYQEPISGKYPPNEAAEMVASYVYEETPMNEAEILRIIVSRESTDEHFIFEVLCQPTVDYNSFYIPDKKHPNRNSMFMPDYKRLSDGGEYAN